MQHLTQMAIFAKVIEENGFSRAAKALGLTKSTVSKHVAELERHLGARLLERSSRTMAPTELGRAFYARCAELLAGADEAVRAVAELRGAARGTLRVFAPSSFGRAFLSPIVDELLDAHPGVEVELVFADRPVDVVSERFDVAIQLVPLGDSSLVVRRIGESRHHLCAAPAYLAARGEPREPEDLRRHDCLVYSEAATAEIWHLEGPEREAAIKVRGRVRANSSESLLDLVLRGKGIGYPPVFVTAGLIAAGKLRPVLPAWQGRSLPIFLVYPAGRARDPKVRAFLDLLIERLGKTDWSPAPSIARA
jgi:DNA-binding transcriptional LysR family regulator